MSASAAAPVKPWERSSSSSGLSPLASTESAKPWASDHNEQTQQASTSLAVPMPPRPWESASFSANPSTSYLGSYGGYNNSGYGGYNSGYGGYNSSYGGYNSGYGGYNSGYGLGYSRYGMGGYGMGGYGMGGYGMG